MRIREILVGDSQTMDKHLTNEEMIKCWRTVTDSYLLTALTQNMEEYPPSVQTIIEEEASERGLIARTGDRGSPYLFGTKAIAWERQVSSQARRRLVSGTVASLVLSGLGMFLSVKFSHVLKIGLWYSCWWVLFLFVPTILLTVNALALLAKKLGIVLLVDSNRWRIFTLCLLYSIVFTVKMSRDFGLQGPWNELAPYVFFNAIFLSVCFGVLSFFLVMGLRGLKYRLESGNTVTR